MLGVGIMPSVASLLEGLLLEDIGGSLESFKSTQEGGWRTRDRAALLDSARNRLRKLSDDF